MIDLIALKDHLFTSTGIKIVENLYELPEDTVTTESESKIYIDYVSLISPLEEAIMQDSASEIGNSISLLISVVLDADKALYPQILIDVYKACEHYRPESQIKDFIRTFSFANAEFLRSGNRRIWKSIWVVTFDRFIRN